VLDNWPRFNNGYTGGGWPSAVGWAAQSGGLSLGNVVYENGGEGVDFTGTSSADKRTPHLNVKNVVRNNVIYDNFSVNLYLVSTQGVKAEQNFVFNHPLDPTQTFDKLLALSPAYALDLARRLVPINVGLGDEPGSSFDSQAYLSDITLINNVVVGAKRGFMDWDDGTVGKGHSLKNCLIANNTFVLSDETLPDKSDGYGFLQQSNPATSKNSLIENNIIVTVAEKDDFIRTSFLAAGIPAGITVDYNLYSGPGRWTVSGALKSFAAWKTAFPAWDQHSIQAGGAVGELAELNLAIAKKPVYDWSKAKTADGSPGRGAGTDLSARFNDNFVGAPRARGAFDIGAF
ncbi:MAG: Parallel beta-helix repeat protein, partial [Gemmatimonadetes bacterium]|nr:Parallel beta-helix repeat protein [Gemmatimonadota bacterium]